LVLLDPRFLSYARAFPDSMLNSSPPTTCIYLATYAHQLSS